MNDYRKQRLIWYKGEIIPIENATINIMSTTAQYGINVFEGVRCYYNVEEKKLFGFRLLEHLKRLLDSAKLLRFNLPKEINQEYIKRNFVNIIRANGYRENIYVKICMFLDNEIGWYSSEPISTFINPFPKDKPAFEKPGVDCCVSSWERINESAIPPRIKTGANYINGRLALMEANLNGYDYSIILNRNYKVAEGPGACIFIVRNNKLITPPITASILESITRLSILELATSELNINIEEREIDRTELYIADEIFLVGTQVEIVPVLSVDHIPINNRNVGKLTTILINSYSKLVRGDLDRFKKWLIEIY